MTTAIVNPTILLESANFTKMLDYCKERFVYILVDMPPLASVADALNIARHCDGSVLVVHSRDAPQGGGQLGANAVTHRDPAAGDRCSTAPMCVVNGVVYLTVYSSGSVMIMAQVQVQG